MRGIPSLITDIRKNVFTEVARMAYSGRGYEAANDLPYIIVPGDRPLHRESIFLERAIAGERVRLAMGLSLKGEGLWKIVGKEPSGTAFNSLVQLEVEKGKPRNPFINAGAIVVADMLLSELDDPDGSFLGFIRQLSGSETIDYNMEVAESERQHGYLNAAIANLLKYHGTIKNDIEDVLMFYFRMCSVEMSCTELAQAFLAFTNFSQFDYAGFKLTSSQIKRLNAVMQTCGFYDEAGEFSYLVGLPGKSGVGGGIVAIYPSRYSVAVWSPRLNSKGNSVMGMKALELLTTYTQESIF